jgi:DNA primase catalytic core
VYITNTDEVIPLLRVKLPEYLIKKGVMDLGDKKFCCIVHSDHDPSMHLNPKTNYETAHCFSCGATIDIFTAASHLENMPASGAEWMTVTIPHLAELLEIDLQTGEPSPRDAEKLKLYKIAQDIANIIEDPAYHATEYLDERGWTNELETGGSINEDTLIAKLIELGWSANDITTSLMVRTSTKHFFGEDKVTFTIRDWRGRPTGVVSRSLSESGPKYINSTETLIYEKRNALLGIDKALKAAKHNGLYIVEGPGDRLQCLRLNVLNVAAICGTAFTPEHVVSLRMLGIKDVYLCLDWDEAGLLATTRIFDEVLKTAVGLNFWVIEAPEDMGENTDPDAYLANSTDRDDFLKLPKTSAFEWMMKRIASDNDGPEIVCQRMVPIIASESAAVRREILIRQLQDFTGVSYQSIASDVNTIRSGKHEERKGRLLAATEKYKLEVERDPENMSAALAQHEHEVRIIESDYERDIIGVNYQLSRYDALQEMKKRSENGGSNAVFLMEHFSELARVLSGGMLWTLGTLVYVGGRANSGKTATCILAGLDVALTDPDAIVIMHFTDDSLGLAEPRLATNISAMLNKHIAKRLSIGQAAAPEDNIQTNEEWGMYKQAGSALRDLIREEKLVLIDSEDGPTLSALERTLRYIRQRHQDKKIMVICDNTHNYADFGHMDRTSQMTHIANMQKHMTIKYRCCMLATVEYRKNMPMDTSKLKLPVNDDIADARALMYRANCILHVYNDLNDRGDYAEFFWADPAVPDEPLPRLNIIFGKNKITKFKKSLTLDLDPDSVTLRQVDLEDKVRDYENYTGDIDTTIIGGRIIVTATDYGEEAQA